MKKLLVLLIATFVSTTAVAASSDQIAEVVLSEYESCTTITTFDSFLVPPAVFKVSQIESLTISDGILEMMVRHRETASSASGGASSASGGKKTFSKSHKQKRVLVKDETRWIRKATNQLNLAWIVKDKNTGKKTMLLAFTGPREPLPAAEVLSKVLETEYEAATNTVTLWNLVKVPVIIDKANSTISSFSVADATLSVEFDGPGALQTLIVISLNALQQVTVKQDKVKGTRSVNALFKGDGA